MLILTFKQLTFLLLTISVASSSSSCSISDTLHQHVPHGWVPLPQIFLFKYLYWACFVFRHGLRENFKYYFADFVRKGGTPPPLRTKFSPKKRLRIWGVPPPPFTDKNRKVVFEVLPKIPDLLLNNGAGPDLKSNFFYQTQILLPAFPI